MNEAIMDNAPKRTGRPKGSKTKKVPVVVTHYQPALCPKCKADDSKVINVPRNRIIRGLRHTWRNMLCKCGQKWRQIAIEQPPS